MDWRLLITVRAANAHCIQAKRLWCFCRKKKAVHKTTSTDDKRLQNTLKRLGVNTIPGIEEVNIFQGDDVINFTNPKGAAGRPPGAGTPVHAVIHLQTQRRCRLSCRRSSEVVMMLLPVPAVQASIAANTYVISGPSQTKSARSPASLYHLQQPFC